jgi:hypothetical protein
VWGPKFSQPNILAQGKQPSILVLCSCSKFISWFLSLMAKRVPILIPGQVGQMILTKQTFYYSPTNFAPTALSGWVSDNIRRVVRLNYYKWRVQRSEQVYCTGVCNLIVLKDITDNCLATSNWSDYSCLLSSVTHWSIMIYVIDTIFLSNTLENIYEWNINLENFGSFSHVGHWQFFEQKFLWHCCCCCTN